MSRLAELERCVRGWLEWHKKADQGDGCDYLNGKGWDDADALASTTMGVLTALRTADAEPGSDVVERARKIAAEVLCRENWKPGVKAGIYDEIMAGHHDGEPLVVVALRALNATKPTDAEVRREALEEAARIADSFRDKWSNAGGFGGHSAGARIIAAVIRQHKDDGR